MAPGEKSAVTAKALAPAEACRKSRRVRGFAFLGFLSMGAIVDAFTRATFRES